MSSLNLVCFTALISCTKITVLNGNETEVCGQIGKASGDRVTVECDPPVTGDTLRLDLLDQKVCSDASDWAMKFLEVEVSAEPVLHGEYNGSTPKLDKYSI